MESVEIWAICSRCKARNLVIVSTAGPNQLACPECSSVMLDYEPVRGYVYVLSNHGMPGLLKIGFTARSVEDRLAELNSGTAVPAPFVIECIFPSPDPEEHELQVHQRLAAVRLPAREFFKVTVADAVRAVAEVCGQPAKYLRDGSLAIRPRTPKQDSATPEEAAERFRKWQEQAWRR